MFFRKIENNDVKLYYAYQYRKAHHNCNVSDTLEWRSLSLQKHSVPLFSAHPAVYTHTRSDGMVVLPQFTHSKFPICHCVLNYEFMLFSVKCRVLDYAFNSNLLFTHGSFMRNSLFGGFASTRLDHRLSSPMSLMTTVGSLEFSIFSVVFITRSDTRGWSEEEPNAE